MKKVKDSRYLTEKKLVSQGSYKKYMKHPGNLPLKYKALLKN